MLEMARGFIELAREEMETGYSTHDYRRIRDAAEKGWVSALHAVDAAMARHGLIPQPGAMAHHSRHRFLERAGRQDLSDRLSVFADQLHGRIFCAGEIPDRKRMSAAMDEVQQFMDAVAVQL
jgi:hypothetical protein